MLNILANKQNNRAKMRNILVYLAYRSEERHKGNEEAKHRGTKA